MHGTLYCIFKKKGYRIYSTANNEYIVHNSKLDFHTHHTHITNYNTCIYIINLCIHKSIPNHISEYLLISLLRLSDNEEYKNKVLKKLEKNKNQKGKHYNGKYREIYS